MNHNCSVLEKVLEDVEAQAISAEFCILVRGCDEMKTSLHLFDCKKDVLEREGREMRGGCWLGEFIGTGLCLKDGSYLPWVPTLL